MKDKDSIEPKKFPKPKISLFHLGLIKRAAADKPIWERKAATRSKRIRNKLVRAGRRHIFLKAGPKRLKKRLSGSEKRRRKAGHRSIMKRTPEGMIIRPEKAPMIMKVKK